jgi:alpha-1,6-mannosyltransferase
LHATITRRAHRRRARVLLIAAGSAPLYLLVHVIQRRMFDGAGNAANLLLYAFATVVLFLLYGGLLRVCRDELDRRTRALTLTLPVLCNVAWLAAAPSLSIDVLSYISHGFVRAGLGENPYLVPSSAMATSPIAADLAAYGWRPVHPVTPYGPLITQLETVVAGLPWSVDAMVIAFKVVAVACSLATAVLIWVILGQVRPDRRDLGTAAYLWNPMVVVELAGEGHNDAIMVVLVLLALALSIRRRAAGGLIAMAAAILAKYLPALFVPLQAAYLWRTLLDSHRRLARQVAVGVAVAVFLAAALYAPYWAGVETFSGIKLTGGVGHTGSTPTMMLEVLSRVATESAMRPVVTAVAACVLVVYVATRAINVRDEQTLLRAAAGASVAYVLLASPSYWPWYAVLPVALLALVPGRRSLILLVAMSLGSRLAAPLDVLYVSEAIGRFAYLLLTWLFGIGVPLLALTVPSIEGGRSLYTDRRRRST